MDSEKSATKPAPQADDTPSYVTGLRLVTVIASVTIACLLMLIDTMVISTAIPRITDEFQSLTDVGWYASAYQFGSAAPQPLTGKVYTHFSTKWSFLLFFGIFEIGSVLCGTAISSAMLIVGRAVAGIGAAGIINGSIIIISGSVPLEKRPALIGITVGIGQLGLVIGPLIGGAFTSYSVWRWCFYINLPIGALVALGIILIHIPDQTPKPKAVEVFPKLHHALDVAGFIFFAPATLQLLLALQFGGNLYPWGSSQIIGLLCGSAATFFVWFFWNRHKGDEALFPRSIIGQRTIWAAGLFQALFMSALYGAVYFLPIYFQAVNGATAMLSGVYLLPTIVPELVMAAVTGALLSKIGYVIPPAIFSVILLSVGSGLYSLLQPDVPTGWWVGFQLIAGVGSGIGVNLGIVAAQAFATGEMLSSVMAFIVFAQAMGPAISLALCNVIFIESLKLELARQVPGVDVAAIIKAGATGFRSLIQPQDLQDVIVVYSNSVDRVFFLVAALAAACGVVCWGMGWNDIRHKQGSQDDEVLENDK